VRGVRRDPIREPLLAARAPEHHAPSFHGAGRYRRRLLSSSAALLSLALALGCGRPHDATEPILEAARAVEKKDADAVASCLASGYHDGEHADAAAVVARVRQLTLAYDRPKVSVTGMKLAQSGSTARARFRAELSGAPKSLPGLEGFLPRTSAWDFEVNLVREDGRWKIATASWTPAG
jgi:hypothetical protein